MKLNMALKDKLMDIRLRGKLVEEGKLSKAELDKFLSSIPDETDNFLSVDKLEEKKKMQKKEEVKVDQEVNNEAQSSDDSNNEF